MSERLLLDFDAFFSGGTDNERVWMACVACGVRRWVERSE